MTLHRTNILPCSDIQTDFAVRKIGEDQATLPWPVPRMRCWTRSEPSASMTRAGLTQQLRVQAHEENYTNAARTFTALERDEIHTALTALAPLDT